MQTEPARIVAAIIGGVTALISLLVAFGFELSEDQKTAILGVVAVIAPIVAGFVIREKVYSPNSVEKIADKQYAAGTPPTVKQPQVPPPAKV